VRDILKNLSLKGCEVQSGLWPLVDVGFSCVEPSGSAFEYKYRTILGDLIQYRETEAWLLLGKVWKSDRDCP